MNNPDSIRPGPKQADLPAYVEFVQRDVEVVALKLESLACALRRHKPALESGKRDAQAVAADVVSDYTQGVGALGSFLWNLLRDAATLDKVRREVLPGGDR